MMNKRELGKSMDCHSMQPQVERFYNLNEVSALLGIKVRTAREWVHNGKLNAVKYPDSKLWFVSESEIRRVQNGN